MGYMHINNLYKDQRVLSFKEVFALEKIHGSSAHISLDKNIATGQVTVNYYAGGVPHDQFVSLFNEKYLVDYFDQIYSGQKIVLFGEAYGGKCQKMADTYGPNLRFVVFDVKIGDNWLNVVSADKVTAKFGLEFVHYVKVKADVELMNEQMERDSVQAIRNGMGVDHPSEGIVIRPPFECYTNNGKRVIAKHKKDNFRETRKKRTIQGQQELEVLKEAEDIANEWVTLMRLQHVADIIQKEIQVENIGKFIPAMMDDIKRESEGEVQWSKACEKAIRKRTALLIKNVCKQKLER